MRKPIQAPKKKPMSPLTRAVDLSMDLAELLEAIPIGRAPDVPIILQLIETLDEFVASYDRNPPEEEEETPAETIDVKATDAADAADAIRKAAEA